jgi:hypothetical protein
VDQPIIIGAIGAEAEGPFETLVASRFFAPETATGLALSAGGLLAVPCESQLSLLDRTTGLTVLTLRSSSRGWGARAWALDPTGTTALVGDDAQIERIDLTTGERATVALWPMDCVSTPVRSIESSPSLEDRVLVTAGEADSRWLSTRTWEYGVCFEDTRYRADRGLPRVACSAQGRHVARLFDRRVELDDGELGLRIDAFEIEAAVFKGMGFTADERSLWVISTDNVLRLFDVETFALTAERPLQAPGYLWGACSLDGRESLALWSEARLFVLDADTLSRRAEIDLGVAPERVFALDGDPSLWSLDGSGSIRRIDASAGAITSPPNEPAIRALEFDAQGTHIIVTRAAGVTDRVRLRDGEQTRIVQRAPCAAQEPASFEVMGEGDRRATLYAGGVRIEPEGVTVAVRSFSSLPREPSWSGRFSRSGRWLAALVGARLAVIDVARAVCVSETKVRLARMVAVSEDGRAAVACEGAIALVGDDGASTIVPLSSDATAIALSSMYDLALVGTLSGDLCLFDLRAPQRRATVPVAPGKVRAIAVDDAMVVLASGLNNVMRVSLDALASLLSGPPLAR